MNSQAALSGQGLLTPVQRSFLSAFAGLPDQSNFYLTGGTALAEFYLGHRLSLDLGFFTAEEALIVPFSYQVDTLGQHHNLQITVVRRFATYVEFAVTQGTESLRVDLALDLTQMGAFNQALAAAERIPGERQKARALSELALGLARVGKRGRAVTVAGRALAVAERTGRDWDEGLATGDGRGD